MAIDGELSPNSLLFLPGDLGVRQKVSSFSHKSDTVGNKPPPELSREGEEKGMEV